MAYVSVMRRQFAAHREWMIRSYVVTFAFVMFRLLEDLDVYGGLGPSAQAVMLAWMAWTVPLLFTEVALQWRRSVGRSAVKGVEADSQWERQKEKQAQERSGAPGDLHPTLAAKRPSRMGQPSVVGLAG